MILRLRSHVSWAWLLLAGACATVSPFDRALDSHSFEDAAALFESDSSLHTHAHALYRAALLYGTPGLPTYDPVRARDLLERMLALDPESASWESSSMLSLLRELDRVEKVADARRTELATRADQLASEADGLRRRIVWLEERIQTQVEQHELLRRVVNRLEADLRDREARLQALQSELDRLKAIDLQTPPRPPPAQLF